MGVACVPSWLVGPQIAAGHLIRLLEQFPSASLDTYAVWPAAEHMPMRLRVTIDTLAARLQGVADL
jgi:DNA-binding transcriptional LysR family regulator